MTMLSVADARGKVRDWLQNSMKSWASGTATSYFKCKLGELNEQQALANQNAAAEWTRQWRDAVREYGLSVDWESRNWARVGRQTLPVRLRLQSADEAAKFVGGKLEQDWHRYKARGSLIRTRLGESSAVRSTLRSKLNQLARFSDAEFETVVRVVEWLRDNHLQPMRPRQLPIRGVDSKWFSAHRKLVIALLKSIGHEEAVTILDAEPRAKMRMLDPAFKPWGLSYVEAPISQLSQLPISPQLAFVFENLETVLAMPEWPGAVAIHGNGYFVNAVQKFEWLRKARVIYWGDLDSHGFAILSILQVCLPNAESVLMDEATLLAHQDMWVIEDEPKKGPIEGLNSAEARALERLRAEGNVRLEQERIPWDTALNRLRTAAGTETSGRLGEGAETDSGHPRGRQGRLGEVADDDR